MRPDRIPAVAGVNNTCTQAGCHNPLNAMGAAQVPAGNLDLTHSAAANEPQQLTSYQQLLFPRQHSYHGYPADIRSVPECG